MTLSRNARIEIVLDVACAWSYIGFARFSKVVAEHRTNGDTVMVTFAPFQLDPDAPADGEPVLQVLTRKFGSGVLADTQRIAAIGAQDGLVFDYDKAIHASTFEAHRLNAAASAQGRGEQMVERLFRAQFTDGLNVADAQTLSKLAAEVGIEFDGVSVGAVRAALDGVRRRGVRGVPLFTFDGGPVLSGAQPAPILRDALRTAAA